MHDGIRAIRERLQKKAPQQAKKKKIVSDDRTINGIFDVVVGKNRAVAPAAACFGFLCSFLLAYKRSNKHGQQVIQS